MKEAPLFLRFINMMINDAIIQLDEGLQVGVVTMSVVCYNGCGQITMLYYIVVLITLINYIN